MAIPATQLRRSEDAMGDKSPKNKEKKKPKKDKDAKAKK